MVTTGPPSKQNTHPTAPPNVAYWVQFRRGPKYQGEYGFDWVEWARNSANPHTAYDDLTTVMGKPISNYEFCYDPGQPGIPARPATATQPAIPAKPAILPRYAPVSGLYKQRYEDELHKGYPKRIVQGNDYYVPWLSMRPHQTVHLKLEVEFLNKNPVQATNWFTVVAHADYRVTINGKTNAAPMQLVPKNKQVLDVTIECLRPSVGGALEVRDELNQPVGELQLADNTLVYELPVRVVYVLLGRPMNPEDPLGATPPRPLYAAGRHTQATLQHSFEALDFITYVNEHTLNQALITCVVQAPPPLAPPTGLAPAYQVLLDEDQLKHDGLLLSNVIHGSTAFTDYCEKVANATLGIGSFAGLTIFVHELDVPPPAPGAVINASGTIFPVEAKTLNVYRAGLSSGSKRTIAHELGHVLGLTHAFPDTDDAEAIDYSNALDRAQQDITKETINLATLTLPADILKAQQGIQNLTTRIAWLTARFAVFVNNPFKFTKFSTENMMDYEQGNIRLSYWHWQWALLQADVNNYYGTKKAAR